MKRLKSFIAVIGGLLVIAAANYPNQTEISCDNVLDRQVKGTHLEDVTVGQAVINTLVSAGATGGVAVVQDCNEPMRYTFTPGDSSLRGVLETIVSTDPRYVWEIKDDVINLIPRNGEPSFLIVRVSKLEINQAETPNEALSQLLATPEVRQAQLNLGRRFVQGGIYPFNPQDSVPKEAKKISVNLKDTTVREALNTIARAHGDAVWMLTQGQCNGRKLFSIDFFAR